MDGSVARNTCPISCISSGLRSCSPLLIFQPVRYFWVSCEPDLFHCPKWPRSHSKLTPSILCFRLELLSMLRTLYQCMPESEKLERQRDLITIAQSIQEVRWYQGHNHVTSIDVLPKVIRCLAVETFHLSKAIVIASF